MIKVEVHGRDFAVPHDVGVFIEEKLKAKLGKYSRHITHAVVWLKDPNGDKGGVDKICHIEVVLAGFEPMNVEEVQEDLRAAIDLAVDRMSHALSHKLERARDKRRETGRKVVRNRKTLSP